MLFQTQQPFYMSTGKDYELIWNRKFETYRVLRTFLLPSKPVVSPRVIMEAGGHGNGGGTFEWHLGGQVGWLTVGEALFACAAGRCDACVLLGTSEEGQEWRSEVEWFAHRVLMFGVRWDEREV